MNMKNIILILFLFTISTVFAAHVSLASRKGRKATGKKVLSMTADDDFHNDCQTTQRWKRSLANAKTYNLNDKVIKGGKLYISLFNENTTNPLGYGKNRQECDQKNLKWMFLARCSHRHGRCKKIMVWCSKYNKENGYSKGQIVKDRITREGKVWVYKSLLDNNTLRPIDGKCTANWKVLGGCFKGVNCSESIHWKKNVTYRANSTVRYRNIQWKVLADNFNEMPRSFSTFWEKLGHCLGHNEHDHHDEQDHHDDDDRR